MKCNVNTSNYFIISSYSYLFIYLFNAVLLLLPGDIYGHFELNRLKWMLCGQQ